MTSEKFCVGHMNGYDHFESVLRGLEDEFDVGIRISEEESDRYEVDPHTGVKVWYEPRVVLYASVAARISPTVHRTLRYGLTRAAYGTELNSINEAVPIILELALPPLESDLRLLRLGKEPDSGTRIVMLRWWTLNVCRARGWNPRRVSATWAIK